MSRLIEVFCRTVETIAAILLGIVMLLVVVSTFGRYALAMPVPDSFDISRYLLGACVMWGFAVIGLRGGHIQVDIIADMVGPRARRWIDTFAWALLLLFIALIAWKMLGRVQSAMRTNESTFELRLAAWPFLAVIWLGAAASVVTVSVKLLRIITGRELVDSADDRELEEATHGKR
ncbi:TRAP transporter small permease [Pararhodobacter zhoushanensis]|uniref:TRAP transporter small permease protein n=1 Tax=Pararhodobacter zhoushanensis TaxID=2479545 RepID=A0ABT3GU22_9RHOB|nr:TRAP transporter small permease [Pararhodobacter zhoushanensis]MCW1931033.1 TRAP transporter small permease [Pararhodobacter zhoushanensis]